MPLSTRSARRTDPGLLRRCLAPFGWLTFTADPVPGEVRHAMLSMLAERRTAPLFSSAGSIFIAGVALWRTGASWPWYWIIADLGLTAARLAALVASSRALARGEAPPREISVLIGLLYFLLIGLGCSACLLTGDPLLAIMAIGHLAVILGNVSSRNAVVPRYGIAALSILTLSPAVAMLAAPFPGIRIAVFQPVLALAGMIFVLRQNYSVTLRMFMAEHENRRLATTDPLTGLPNRLALYEEFGRIDLRLRRAGPNAGFALLSLDLDGFKGVNDMFGHPAGDELLRHVARRLQNSVRRGDGVFRLGGDEFVILLPGAGAAEAAFIARRVITAIGRPFDLGAAQLARIGASVGSAVAPDHGSTAQTVLARSDAALYEAKRAGRGVHLPHAGLAG